MGLGDLRGGFVTQGLQFLIPVADQAFASLQVSLKLASCDACLIEGEADPVAFLGNALQRGAHLIQFCVCFLKIGAKAGSGFVEALFEGAPSPVGFIPGLGQFRAQVVYKPFQLGDGGGGGGPASFEEGFEFAYSLFVLGLPSGEGGAVRFDLAKQLFGAAKQLVGLASCLGLPGVWQRPIRPGVIRFRP